MWSSGHLKRPHFRPGSCSRLQWTLRTHMRHSLLRQTRGYLELYPAPLVPFPLDSLKAYIYSLQRLSKGQAWDVAALVSCFTQISCLIAAHALHNMSKWESRCFCACGHAHLHTSLHSYSSLAFIKARDSSFIHAAWLNNIKLHMPTDRAWTPLQPRRP